VRVWDVESGKEPRIFSGHSDYVSSVAFSPDGRTIVSASFDGTIRIWDVATGKEIAQFISFTDGEWLCVTPEGYYNASPKGDTYLNVRIGNEVYGIDQYRELLFRPDLVALRIEGGDVQLADAAAVIENATLQPPEISILSPAGGDVQGAGTVVLSAAINGRTQAIKSVRILLKLKILITNHGGKKATTNFMNRTCHTLISGISPGRFL
jgi:hypothetical protein